MSSLSNKNIVLGITGGIAAYKSAELVRLLLKLGAQVRVVMTKAATAFITPLTLQALSGKPVHIDLLDTEAEAAMGHIELARWADLLLIAPASADFMSKLANGEGSDLLSTLCLATPARIAIAPAMNQGMWASSATQANIACLRERDIDFIGPASGVQACGDIGLGRMVEVIDIADACEGFFTSGRLAGKTVVITAGPTREAIDPVRYLSNHSSGKMGYAIAQAAVEAGANTILISGPVNLETPDRVKRISVTSARDMLNAVNDCIENVDIFIGAAAVADYRPEVIANDKIKKTEQANDVMSLRLVPNPDIIAAVAQREIKPLVVGFAAETQNVAQYAQEKLKRKNLDFIIANDVSDTSIGFNSDDNAIHVFSRDSDQKFEKQSKASLARQIIELLAEHQDDRL
ncbi:MAG: phosphopantothenoylcysteine decarboxylase/phosphopantothenate--cysteine ligase [Arenicella sp.]|jgi:phosphopantothenoylcysteine decarboxylase/phosphopantothenate--cysteine ligase